MVRRIKTAELELRRRGVAHLSVFGSVAKGLERQDSDVDIAVDIEPGRSFSVIRMEDTRLMLEDVLGRPVDLGETSTLRPHIRESFEQDRVQVF
ncbi:hypothetical protein A6A04_16905 [Paramagnetospirillum marisnigri]|uniref:Polymerase nucleotidyl transferase domain-containing protein n=1 Tax=Paramagnetospirillum marisnigri TaxID=1285242 RepID=A0A178MQC0_9PROT|nr:hypothetical protein A6A04_16905 [Paramagnetospirillum marisnigri]